MSEHLDTASRQNEGLGAEMAVLQHLSAIRWSHLDARSALEAACSCLGSVGLSALGLFHYLDSPDVNTCSHTGSRAVLPGDDTWFGHLERAVALSQTQPMSVAGDEVGWPASPDASPVTDWLAAAQHPLAFTACQTALCRAVLLIDVPKGTDDTLPRVLGRLLCDQAQMVAESEASARESVRLSSELEDMYARLLGLAIHTSVNLPLNLVAHQFNNFLTPILGYTQLLLQPGTSQEEVRLYTKRVLTEAEQMRLAVDNMLQFARRQMIGPQQTPLNDLLRETARLHAYELQKGNVSIEFELDPTLPSIKTDPFKMQVVFSNILKNAVQAMKGFRDPGTVLIRTSRCDPTQGRLLIEFTDVGPGLDPQLLTKVFEPFYTSGKNRGMGLGLTISRILVEEQGGAIYARSVLGQGTTVAVELPLTSQ